MAKIHKHHTHFSFTQTHIHAHTWTSTLIFHHEPIFFSICSIANTHERTQFYTLCTFVCIVFEYIHTYTLCVYIIYACAYVFAAKICSKPLPDLAEKVYKSTYRFCGERERERKQPIAYKHIFADLLRLGHLDHRTKRNTYSLIQFFKECTHQFRFTCLTKITCITLSSTYIHNYNIFSSPPEQFVLFGLCALFEIGPVFLSVLLLLFFSQSVDLAV